MARRKRRTTAVKRTTGRTRVKAHTRKIGSKRVHVKGYTRRG